MSDQTRVIGAIPEFTSDETDGSQPVTPDATEVPEVATQEEKETPSVPPQTEPAGDPNASDDTPALSQDELKELQGLRTERVNLLKEISELRGQKRELKQEELRKVEERMDELGDLNPEDIAIIDRVLRAKGYMTKEEASRMAYEATKNEELARFLEKYPEYKPENDPSDTNWAALQREVSLYRMPDDPRRIGEILERAHRTIVKVPSGPSVPAQARRVEVAGAGKGGSQRPSESRGLDQHKRDMYRAGGWTEEEINEIEKRLST